MIVGVIAGLTDCFDTSGLSGSKATSDGGVTSDSGASGSCTGIVSDNFDSSPLGGQWDSTTQSGVLLALDSSSATSPPNSLSATFPGGRSGGTGFLEKTFSARKTLCCSFAFRVTGASNISGPRIQGKAGNYQIRLGVGSGVIDVGESLYAGSSDPGISRILTSFPTSSDWRTMVFSLSFPATSGEGSLAITVDGETSTYKIGGDAYDLGVDAFDLGLTYTAGAQLDAWRFDDVSCGPGP